MTRHDAAKLLAAVRWWPVVKTVALALGGLLVAAGFDYESPQRRFARTDSTIAAVSARIDTVATAQRQSDENWDTFFRLTCLSRQYSARELQFAKIDCDRVLGGGPAQAGTVRVP